jgi:hypothetical protein
LAGWPKQSGEPQSSLTADNKSNRCANKRPASREATKQRRFAAAFGFAQRLRERNAVPLCDFPDAARHYRHCDLSLPAQQLCIAQELGESQIYDAMTGRRRANGLLSTI